MKQICKIITTEKGKSWDRLVTNPSNFKVTDASAAARDSRRIGWHQFRRLLPLQDCYECQAQVPSFRASTQYRGIILHVPQGAVLECWKQPSRALWIAKNLSVAMEKYLFSSRTSCTIPEIFVSLKAEN